MAPRTRLRALLLTLALVLCAAAPAAAAPAWLPATTLVLSGSTGDAIDPAIAVAPDGTVVALSSRFDGTDFRAEASIRPPGGNFSTPVRLSASGALATLDQIAVDGKGNFVAVWRRNDGTNERIEFADMQAGGAFAVGQRITPDAGTSFESNPNVAADPQGEAFV